MHQLPSSNERTRKRALREVNMVLCHQGFVRQETADAVPYLIEVLQKSHVKDKESILALLADIASADSEVTWKWHGEEGEGERPLIKEHIAVGAGISIFIALLDAPTIAIQFQATCILSQFPERGQELHGK